MHPGVTVGKGELGREHSLLVSAFPCTTSKTAVLPFSTPKCWLLLWVSLGFKIGLISSGCQVNVGAQDPPSLFQQQPHFHMRIHPYYKLGPCAARTQSSANQRITFPFTTVIGSSMGRWLRPGQSELPSQASWRTDGELDSHPAPPHPVSTQPVLNHRGRAYLGWATRSAGRSLAAEKGHPRSLPSIRPDLQQDGPCASQVLEPACLGFLPHNLQLTETSTQIPVSLL